MPRGIERTNYSVRPIALAVILLFLTSCGAPAPKAVKVAPPSLPKIDQHVEPVESAISWELHQTNFNDPVEVVLLQAQVRFDRGEELYKQGGSLKQAKEEFNSAVDLLLDTATTYPNELRLQRALTDLVARIHAIELAAIRDGEGLTDGVE